MLVTTTPTPTVASSSRLRARDFSGLGRRLRGTFQATFIAYCDGLGDTEAAVQRDQDAHDQPGRATADPVRRLQLGSDHRELVQGRVQHPLLRLRITVQHETEIVVASSNSGNSDTNA